MKAHLNALQLLDAVKQVLEHPRDESCLHVTDTDI